jgi:hypothetical protein
MPSSSYGPVHFGLGPDPSAQTLPFIGHQASCRYFITSKISAKSLVPIDRSGYGNEIVNTAVSPAV